MIYPATPPDLFAEQPLVLLGRKGDAISGRLHLTGTAASGDRYRQSFDLQFDAAGNPAVAQLWGRARIKQLTNQMVGGDTKAGVEAVTDTALAYQLLSQYTAFVAVSDDVRSNLNQQSVSVQVPVEMPEAVSHLGIYGSAAAAAPSMRMQYTAALPSRTLLEDSAPSPAFSPPPRASAPQRQAPRSEPLRSRSLSPSERAANNRSIQPSVQILSATGLDERTIDLLGNRLRAVQLPTGFSGQVVFEFQVRDRRVIQLVLDEQASTLTEAIVIDELRRSLLIWRASATADTVRLVLQIQS